MQCGGLCVTQDPRIALRRAPRYFAALAVNAATDVLAAALPATPDAALSDAVFVAAVFAAAVSPVVLTQRVAGATSHPLALLILTAPSACKKGPTTQPRTRTSILASCAHVRSRARTRTRTRSCTRARTALALARSQSY